MRRLEASLRRATPKGHETFISRTAPHQNLFLHQVLLAFRTHLGNHNEKFSDEEMAEMRRASDDLVARYGTDYRRDWGWARPLFPGNEQPSFASLERRAGFEHLRPWYRLANHGIHSEATGAIHVIDLYGHGREMLAGPSNVGLADPANGALIALYQVTTALLIHGGPTSADAEDIITCEAVQVMLDRAEQAFLEIHSALEEEEAALRAEDDRRPG